MTDATFVFAGWIISAVVIALYTLWVLKRGRDLSRRVPPTERRWM